LQRQVNADAKVTKSLVPDERIWNDALDVLPE